MARKSVSNPIKMIAKTAGNKTGSLKGIGSVLQHQNDALNAIQSAAQPGSIDRGASSADHVQVIDALGKIHRAILDGNELGKRTVNNTQVMSLGAMAQAKLQKMALSKLSSIGSSLKTNLNPDNIKKAMLGNFSMFSGARNKVADINYKQQMRSGGDTRSNKDLNAAAVDSRQKSDALAKINARLATANAGSDPNLKKDLAAQQKDAQDKLARSRVVNPSRPVTPQGVFTGDQASVALHQTPSDKGNIAQSTTDVLAEKQVVDEQAKERLVIEKSKLSLLQQISANTGAMSGRKSSAAGGKEDVAGATMNPGRSAGMGAAVGAGAGSSLSKVFGAMGTGLSKAFKGFGGLLASGANFAKWGAKSISSLGKALVPITARLGAMGLGILSGPVGWATLGVGAAAIGVYSYWDDIKPAFAKMWKDVKAWFSSLDFSSLWSGLTAIPGFGGISSMFSAVKGLFTPNKTVTDAVNQGKAAGAAIVTGSQGGEQGKSKQTDAQNDQLEQQAGVRYDHAGRMTVVDKKKYDAYIQARGGKMPKDGIQSGQWTTAAVPTSGSARKTGSVLDNATKEIRESKKKRDEMLAKKSGGSGTIVNSPSTVNNSSTTTSYKSIRNNESSVSRYMQARYL